jgi:mono/diheme cytochrome c family protein
MTITRLKAIIAAGAAAVMWASAQPNAQQVPPPALALDVLTGGDSFRFYCASCHGDSGRGDGPTAAVLKTKPADLTTLSRRNGGAFPRQRTVDIVTGSGRAVPAHGAPDMPLWGPIFRALDTSDARVRQRIDNIVSHIETLQEASSASSDLGASLFATHCATCHGAGAQGNGPMAPNLRHPPPDLTRYTARNGGKFPAEHVRRIIDGRDVASHGDRQMPVWGNAFTSSKDGVSQAEARARIEAIVKYLEAIQERAAE